MNFSIEIAINRASEGYGPLDGPPTIADYSTNSVVDFTSYMASAIEHFRAMVMFERDVTYVAMLVRTYRDHHTVSIDRHDGTSRVRTNQ